MTDFRYDQFCPLARAAELLGERWTLLILRELTLGPQRFSDLRRRLGSVSSSVLAERLSRLEARGLVRQRALPPPAASTIYELAPAGEAARPALIELARWGTLFLDPPAPGDRLEPAWLRIGLEAFARSTPCAPRRFEIRVADGDQEHVIRVAGGPAGASVSDERGPVDATLRGDPQALLGVISGALSMRAALSGGALQAEGDLAALDALPGLFDLTDSPLTSLLHSD